MHEGNENLNADSSQSSWENTSLVKTQAWLKHKHYNKKKYF